MVSQSGVKVFLDFNWPADGGRRVGGWFVSLAFHAACNSSPDVRRSNSGQQVHAGHVCWLETACGDSAALV